MARVILFGGGDGGGLIIGPNGIRPIPPFDPGLRAQLQAVSLLTNAASASRELQALNTKLANLVVTQVEGVVGPLEREGSLAYQDDGGGFVCGTTGKPPIKLKVPRRIPDLDDLISDGLLESELVSFISSGNVDAKSLLADPARAASKAGVRLSERSLAQLSAISPAQVEKIADPEAREIAQYFHKVVEDGRFLGTWSTRPHEVSNALGVKLSDSTLDRIIAGGNVTLRPGGGGETANAAVGVAVAVGVVIMLVTKDGGRLPINVLDRSGVQKF